MPLFSDASAGQLLVAVALILPGFISTRVYELFVPSRPRDFSKSFVEFIGYSAFNYVALAWLVVPRLEGWRSGALGAADHLVLLAVAIGFPALWPILLLACGKWAPVARRIRNPTPTAWDHVFGRRRRYWVILHLNDGRRVGGLYGVRSFATSYPEPWQIYLEELHRLKPDGTFDGLVDGSAGGLIPGDDIEMVELKVVDG